MRAIERGLDSLGLLTDSLREVLRRRMRELGGVALIVLALLLGLALATWSVQDPSLSHATNAPVRNVLGLPGAVVSDLLMQLVGIAALALALPIATWGWRLTTHRPLSKERIRLLFWIMGVLFAATFAACLPRSAAWPLPAGLGGVIGDALLRLSVVLSGGFLPGLTHLLVATIAGIAMLVCAGVAVGFGWQRSAEPDRSSRPRAARGARFDLARLDHAWLAQPAGARRPAHRAARQPPGAAAARAPCRSI